MSNAISKSYNSIKELPSEVRSSFDERDQEKWMDAYNKASENKEPEEAKVDAWMSMVDAPSSLAVETWGSVEVRDADGELVPVKTIEEYADKFIENGGLMHDSHSNVPVGTVWDYEVRKHPETGQDGIVFYFNIYRDGEVFERARDDILSGRKQAVSIGAEAPRGGYKCDDRGCYVERDVTDLYELSICETPANPEAYFINVGKDIAKAKTPIKGEVFRIGIKDVVVHQDYTTCPLQKCKHDLLNKGFKDIHITDNGIVTAKSKKNEYKLFKAIHKMGYPFRYDLKKEQFEIMPDYGVEQAIEEAVENGWAHEDQIGHICLTKEIPKEVFIDWYDRGFLCKIGDFYCLKGDDVAKDGINKMDMPDEVKLWANRIIEEIETYQNGGPSRSDMVSRIKMYIEQINQSLDRKYDYDDYLNESTKKKVKKDGGAMGVSSAGATNAVYGSKPTSLVTPTGDKKYGKKKKTKKEFTDDGNVHAVGSRQAKKFIDSISKRCPNGYHKDEKTGQCVNAQGEVYQGKQEQPNQKEPKSENKPQTDEKKREKLNRIFDKGFNNAKYMSRRVGGKCTPYLTNTKFKGLPKNTPIVINESSGDMVYYYKGEWHPLNGDGTDGKTLKNGLLNEYKGYSKSEKFLNKSYGNYFDAIENFIVDSPDGVYYNDILSEFSDSLDEDDVLDALEQICNDGGIVYNDNTERFVVAKKVRKSKIMKKCPKGHWKDPENGNCITIEEYHQKYGKTPSGGEEGGKEQPQKKEPKKEKEPAVKNDEYWSKSESFNKIMGVLEEIDPEVSEYIKDTYSTKWLMETKVKSSYGTSNMMAYLARAFSDGAIDIGDIESDDFGDYDFEDYNGTVRILDDKWDESQSSEPSKSKPWDNLPSHSKELKAIYEFDEELAEYLSEDTSWDDIIVESSYGKTDYITYIAQAVKDGAIEPEDAIYAMKRKWSAVGELDRNGDVQMYRK